MSYLWHGNCGSRFGMNPGLKGAFVFKAVIEYHRTGLQGSFSLEGLIEPETAGELFQIHDGVAYAFLIPPPTTLLEYLSEGINALCPRAYENSLTFAEALEELKTGKEARAFFAQHLAESKETKVEEP